MDRDDDIRVEPADHVEVGADPEPERIRDRHTDGDRERPVGKAAVGRPGAVGDRRVVLDAFREPEDREIAHLAGLVGQRERIRPKDADHRTGHGRECLVERGRDRRVDLGQPVGRDPRTRLDVHLGRGRVGQGPMEARERDGLAVHDAGREEGRGERAHDPRGKHDRPVGAGSAEADPEQSAERRDQLRRLPEVDGSKSAEYTEGLPETGILGSPGPISEAT